MSINVKETANTPVDLTLQVKSLSFTSPTHGASGVSNNAVEVSVTSQPALTLSPVSTQVNEDVVARPSVKALSLDSFNNPIGYTPTGGDVGVDSTLESLSLSPPSHEVDAAIIFFMPDITIAAGGSEDLRQYYGGSIPGGHTVTGISLASYSNPLPAGATINVSNESIDNSATVDGSASGIFIEVTTVASDLTSFTLTES